VEAALIDLAYPQRGTAVVAISGEVDLAVRDELTKVILEAVEDQPTASVIVDLAKTTFMDSTGIHILISGREAAIREGVEYQVRGAQGIVREVLTIAGVLDTLESPTADGSS
jgi:anti-sigma B factor antagonist